MSDRVRGKSLFYSLWNQSDRLNYEKWVSVSNKLTIEKAESGFLVKKGDKTFVFNTIKGLFKFLEDELKETENE